VVYGGSVEYAEGIDYADGGGYDDTSQLTYGLATGPVTSGLF
jgi:hypothetical protein